MDRQELRSLAYARGGLKVGEKILSWDTGGILEEAVRNTKECYIADGEELPTDEQLSQEIGEDYDFWESAWNDMLDALDQKMSEKNPECEGWYCEVDNFGWQSRKGCKFFQAEDAGEFLNEILPDTDNTFHIYDAGEGFAINNFHHDSPWGKEWYYVVPNRPQEATIRIPASDWDGVLADYARAISIRLYGECDEYDDLPEFIGDDRYKEYKADFNGSGNYQATLTFCIETHQEGKYEQADVRVHIRHGNDSAQWELWTPEWPDFYERQDNPLYEIEINDAWFTINVERTEEDVCESAV